MRRALARWQTADGRIEGTHGYPRHATHRLLPIHQRWVTNLHPTRNHICAHQSLGSEEAQKRPLCLSVQSVMDCLLPPTGPSVSAELELCGPGRQPPRQRSILGVSNAYSTISVLCRRAFDTPGKQPPPAKSAPIIPPRSGQGLKRDRRAPDRNTGTEPSCAVMATSVVDE